MQSYTTEKKSTENKLEASLWSDPATFGQLAVFRWLVTEHPSDGFAAISVSNTPTGKPT